MKLTTGLICDRLSEQFAVRYAVSHDKGTLTGRPVFYEEGCCSSDHVCIIRAETALHGVSFNGVYLSIGEVPEDFSAQNIELITVPAGTSLSVLFNALQNIFDYYDAWENKMTAIVEADRGYSELVQCSTHYLGCPISIVDDDFTVIAISEHSAVDFRDEIDHDKISSSIMNDLISDPLFSKGLHNTDVFDFKIGGESFLSYNFKRGGKYLGRVSLNLRDAYSETSYRFLFRSLIQKIDVMLKKYGSFLLHKETVSALREIFSGCLANKQPDRQYMEFRLNENGWSYNDRYMLIRLQPEFRHEWQLHANYLIPLIEKQWPGACALEHEQYILVLLNVSVFEATKGNSFMQELAYFVRESLMLAGISRTFTGLDRLSSYYRQTELAVTLGRDADPMSWYYCFDDYALTCWLNYGVMSFSPEQICSHALLDLLSYDRENNTEFYKSLRTFYRKKFSFTHAADDLYIHRTTLIKRIERITELTKLNMDDPDVNLYVELSFKFIDKVKAAG